MGRTTLGASVLAAVLVAVMGQACGSMGKAPSSSSATNTVTIGPSGGVITSKDGAVTLDVPAGALDDDVAISIAPASGAPAGTIGAAYDLGPDGTTFMTPASLTIRFSLADLGSAPADQLEIATAVSGVWEPSPGSIIDAAARAVSVTTTHLSRWAIIPAASNPCNCHPDAWSACCAQHRGTFGMVGSVCVCSGYDGDFDGFNGCYTARVGGERVANFCSGCLRACCASNGGTVNHACDCDLGSAASVAATLACSRKCFSSPDKVTICAGSVEISPSVGCDSTSCPNGCCDAQGTCQVGVFDDDCGAGGQRCVACSFPETCGGGVDPQACGSPSTEVGGGGIADSGADADAGSPFMGLWSCTTVDSWTYTSVEDATPTPCAQRAPGTLRERTECVFDTITVPEGFLRCCLNHTMDGVLEQTGGLVFDPSGATWTLKPTADGGPPPAMFYDDGTGHDVHFTSSSLTVDDGDAGDGVTGGVVVGAFEWTFQDLTTGTGSSTLQCTRILDTVPPNYCSIDAGAGIVASSIECGGCAGAGTVYQCPASNIPCRYLDAGGTCPTGL